jgi:hypothetical protein
MARPGGLILTPAKIVPEAGAAAYLSLVFFPGLPELVHW